MRFPARHNKQRYTRKHRKPRLERLADRALLAVLGVSPEPGDVPAVLLSQAIEAANATPEPDTIELVAGVYDLAALDVGTITIQSDITIIGASPSQTSIMPAPTAVAFEVTRSATLDLSMLTVYGSAGGSGGIADGSGAINIHDGGTARVSSVALIGLTDTDLLGEPDLQATTLIRAVGNLEIENSALIDSAGDAIQFGNQAGTGQNVISGTIIAGSAGHAIDGQRTSLVLSNSTIFDNGAGVRVAGIDPRVEVSATTIAGNHNRLGLPMLTPSPDLLGYPGLTIGSWMAAGQDQPHQNPITVADDNVITGNQTNALNPTNASGPEIAVMGGIGALPMQVNADFPAFLGTQQMANDNIAAVSAVTEPVSGNRVLRSDQALEGVNVDLVTIDGETIVRSRELGSSGVYWSPLEQRFLVESKPRELSELIDLHQPLAPLHLGQVIGNGAAKRMVISDLARGNAELSTAQQNAWVYLDVIDVASQAGATISLATNATHQPFIFTYTPPSDFEGTDTLTVRALNLAGDEVEGTLTIDVLQSSDITMNVAASELDDLIEVAISTSGFNTVSSFSFGVGFDPTVVRLTDTEFGREFPFLAESRLSSSGPLNFANSNSRVNDKVIVSALGGFSRGSDLVTLTFERIGNGAANIELLDQEFRASFKGQRLGLSNFHQAYYHLSQDDVNRDGSVTVRDALNVVNGLALPTTEGGAEGESAYDRDLDSNGDGVVTPRDALRVINRLALASRQEAESSNSGSDIIFSQEGMAFLDPDREIPSFVGRPGIPIDDGAALDSVDLTAPTELEKATAETIALSAEGVSLQRSLNDVDDQQLFVVQGTGTKLGFGLQPADLEHATDSPNAKLTLVFFRADGSVIEAHPTQNTNRVIGGAIDTVQGESVFVRVGTSDSATLDFRLDLLSLHGLV
ncbi:dockerin type I domain-containing protein [Stieleria sp. TO1_6]|uniref:dockerin type I domain-containing protein n=1 Tax=Stieleria tagensis TaxID=2956795 RepID=UPI00209AC36D|nr:dockerin type I domain-containing protein [Stieleria tagensis]MCO8121148.1 dockerin type I domain-containing protein [Stieleria tagensis]